MSIKKLLGYIGLIILFVILFPFILFLLVASWFIEEDDKDELD